MTPHTGESRYPKTTRLPNIDADIIRLYRSGKGAGEIARIVRRSRYHILCRLRCNGIERRSSGAPDPQWHKAESERRSIVAKIAAHGAAETLRGTGTFKSLGEALAGRRANIDQKLKETVVAGPVSLGREPRRHSPNPVRQHGVSFTVSERTAQR